MYLVKVILDKLVLKIILYWMIWSVFWINIREIFVFFWRLGNVNIVIMIVVIIF